MNRVVVVSACAGAAVLSARWFLARKGSEVAVEVLPAATQVGLGEEKSPAELRAEADARELEYLLSVHPVTSWA
jgi:hypothetical protein